MTESPQQQARGFIFLAALMSFTFTFICYLLELPLLTPGPEVAISEVTKSIWNDGSLSPDYFQKTYRDAASLSKDTHTEVWQDVFALDKNLKLAPKHSLFSAFFAVPFFAVFGNLGFWVAQQLLFFWLIFSTYRIVGHLSGQGLMRSTLLSTCFLTPTLFYSYTYSYDLHGCALMVGGLSIMFSRPLLGGAIMAISLFVRPSYALLVIPLTLFCSQSPTLKNSRRDATFGVVLVFILFLVTNYLLWGNPFLTAYARLPGFHNGELVLMPHPRGLDLKTFTSRWGEKLFSERGILPFNLTLFGFPFVCAWLLKTNRLPFQRNCIIIGVVYSLYIFSYPMWDMTAYGNRFLLPAIYLYLFSFIPWIGRAELPRQSPFTCQVDQRNVLPRE